MARGAARGGARELRAALRRVSPFPVTATLDLLPVRTGNAPENMTTDFLLLQRYPNPGHARFRHYEWRGPAWTFGYSQKIAFVRTQIPEDARDLCRRPTGGGVVDHTDDWTFALVIPRGFALYEVRAIQSYRAVHEVLAGALAAQGVPVELKLRPDDAAGATEDGADAGGTAGAATPAGVCFQRAELFDLVHARTGAKIAGAAQKRNKAGLLLQGSVWKPACGAGAIDWERVHDDFTAALARALGAATAQPGWPEFNFDEEQALLEQYSSSEWIELR